MRDWGWVILTVYCLWILYLLVFIVQFFRVRRARNENEETRRHDYRDPRSMWGLLLESASFAIVWSFMRLRAPELGWLLAGVGVALASVLIGAAAVRELGLHFRINAVVTRDHELIRTGPYGIVRHPIYTSLMGMLLATGLMVSHPWALPLAVLVYLAGTEIRVRAEDKLLLKRFGPEFERYRAEVRAYIPFLR